MTQGFIDELTPDLQVLGIATLQLHYTETRSFGKFRIGIEAFSGGTIKHFQIGESGGQVVGLGADAVRDFLQIGNQHAKLRTPVTDVVLSNDSMALLLQNPCQAVTNYGAAQMPHVHFLGEVR